MSRRDRHLAIVGGGIAGLASAIALERIGVEVTIFEKLDAPPTEGGPLGVWPNALEALELLDLADEVLDHGVPLTGMTIRSASGRLLWRFPLAQLTKGRGPFVIIPRAHLLSLLEERVRGVTRRRALVSGFREGPAGVRPLVSFPTQPPGIFDGLIGADGVRSVVRAQRFPRRFHELKIVGAILAGESQVDGRAWPFPPGESVSIPGHARFLQAISIRSSQQSRILTVHWWSACFGEEDAAVRAMMRPTCGLEGFLRNQAVRAPLHLPLRTRPPARRGRGRVTLVGDAAHLFFPTIGQGAAQGLCGAVELARQVAQTPDLETAFRRYEGWRQAAVARVRRLDAAVTVGLAAYTPETLKTWTVMATAPLLLNEYRAVLGGRS